MAAFFYNFTYQFNIRMKNKLDRYEIENLEDCIPLLEKMYRFKFEDKEIENVKSFNEFCDLIIDKINLENVESCSTQQAFYKLRNSIIEERITEKEKINPETKLEELFPRKNRITLVRKVEKSIGFKLHILSPPAFIFYTLILTSIISFILLFIKWKYGVVGILISVLGFYLCKWFGKELQLKTVKELVEKITMENYLDIRTEKNTVNRLELRNILIGWFVENSGIEKEKLTKATFA